MKKLKTYKLHRDSKKQIVQQIEWLKSYLEDDFDCDYIKSIYPLDKKDLIDVWVELVQRANYPELDWILIYYH